MNRQVFKVVILACGLLVGCNTPTHKEAQFDPDDSFAHGADRPPTAHTMHALARLLISQGRVDEATFTLTRCIEQYPDYTPGRCELAGLQMRSGQLSAAVNTLQEAHNRAPGDTVILNDLGVCQLVRNEPAKALECFSQAGKLAPDNARYTANEALALALLGRFDEAKAAYERVMPPEEAAQNLTILQDSIRKSAASQSVPSAADAGKEP